jgi:hypothetical protein
MHHASCWHFSERAVCPQPSAAKSFIISMHYARAIVLIILSDWKKLV